MSDSKSNVEYTAVPLDEDNGRRLPNTKELPPNYNYIHHECSHGTSRKRRVWRRVLLFTLILLIGGRMLYTALLFFSGHDNDSDEEFNWTAPGRKHHHHHHHPTYNLPFPTPKFPNAPTCEPTIKWEGPSELLLDPNKIKGLIYNIKGMAAHGGIIIRQDPHLKDYINITNKIYLSDESLQREVDVKIKVSDEDYSLTIETPSIIGPRGFRKCVLVDTIITFPLQVHHFKSLLVNVPNSWILAEGLGSVDFAYVNLKTRNGHVRAEDISVATAEISTVNGHVNGGYIVSESLEVRTVNGGVNIRAIANPWADHIDLITSSMNGHLDISVDDLTEKQNITVKARSVNGGIVSTLPNTYKGRFSVSTLVGYTYIKGENITYSTNTRNIKIGHKGEKSEKIVKRNSLPRNIHQCIRHHNNNNKKLGGITTSNIGFKPFDKEHDKSSSLVLEGVTGTIELYFK